MAPAARPDGRKKATSLKKRKRSLVVGKKEEEEQQEFEAPPRPPRTLFGPKKLPQNEEEKKGDEVEAVVDGKSKKKRKENETEKEKETEVVAVNGNKISAKPIFRNKEKVLVLSSRRITFRYRHLMMDIVSLLPHSKKDVKVQARDNKAATLNELVDLKSCTSCLFFECRKKMDLYLWMSKCPTGPSVKFLVKTVHTMAELKLTGNHLKGSRPIITFSSDFDTQPHLQLLKELLQQIFVTPKDHRKSKPFFDHVYAFSLADSHIWFRNYQIDIPHQGTEKIDRGGLDKMTLIEVGPRFCLNPIKIFGGSFGGQTIYENPLYVSPNLIRSEHKRAKATKYQKKVKAKQRREFHVSSNQLEPDELHGVWNE